MPANVMEYPTGLLLNKATGRVHPITFRQAPSSSDTEEVRRYRSLGHHTEGFVSKEEALAWVKGKPEFILTACVWERDGASVPAMTEFFKADEGIDQPAEATQQA